MLASQSHRDAGLFSQGWTPEREPWAPSWERTAGNNTEPLLGPRMVSRERTWVGWPGTGGVWTAQLGCSRRGVGLPRAGNERSEEHTSELQSR